MKLSEMWLRELVNIYIDSEALSNQITMTGLKVEGIKPVAGVFYDVIIGEVIECNQHPSVDNLLMTKVNIGRNRLLNIICNATNCRRGLKVAVATNDSVLPENFKIKTAKIYSERSDGILCSYSELRIFNELSISSDHNSIIELPADAPIGIDIRDYLNLNDNIIEISVTPNRADCLSIIGVAREVAVIGKTELNMPDITPVIATVSDILPIKIESVDACPRYLGRVVKGINVKALTPLWMKEKLRRCGIRSINAVVDITNYVLIELGQPMHAFDKDLIEGGIVVRMAKDGETLVMLDDNEKKLSTDTLVIADYNKVLAVGGIFGSKRSGVSSETRNVLLECAFFDPFHIIGRAYRYNLYTDASHRYERGVDPALQYKAMERATRLLIDICGGEAGPVIDITNETKLPKSATITLHRKKLNRLIGYHIDDTQVSYILRCLGCKVTEGRDQWQAVIPSWRFDIKIEEDLVEEIARVYGYNNIPDKPLQNSLVISDCSESDLSLKRVKTLLNDRGYQEVITYSFVDPKVQQLIHPSKEALILPNPISSKMSVMRLSLWTGLLTTIIYNQNRQKNRARIFETGLKFAPDAQSDLGVRQDMVLAGAIFGDLYEEHWDLPKSEVNFYDIKGDLESILDLTGKLSEIKFCAEAIPALHPGQSAAIYMREKIIGFIGVIHPMLENKLNLKSRTIVFELEWNKVADRKVPQTQYFSRFPKNRRDIAIVVAENIPAADILAECKKVDSNQIVDVNLFDVYRGYGIAKGFKSLAISLILQDTGRTLEEKEIITTVAKCVEALKERFQASIRD